MTSNHEAQLYMFRSKYKLRGQRMLRCQFNSSRLLNRSDNRKARYISVIISNKMANVTRRFISSPLLPKALGPYSSAVQVDQTLYISGNIGLDAKTEKLVPGGVVPETKQALENLGIILKAAGTDYSKVVKATVFLADFKDFEAVNNVYKQFFPSNFPARSAFQVGGLPANARVEIEAIAIVANVNTV